MGEDPRIAAFARANRRRNAIILLVLGILIVAASGIVLAVLVAQPASVLENKRLNHPGGGYELIVIAGGGVLVGLATILGAYRVGRGHLDGVDLATTNVEDLVTRPKPDRDA